MNIESSYNSNIEQNENTHAYTKKTNNEVENKSTEGNNTSANELSEDEKKEIAELKKTDSKVKQHEMAHVNAAQGINVSGANFEYKRGPDGVNYAVGGDVKIDVSEVSGDPEATIAKAQKIARCALAPQDPSSQDRKVAAKARQMENKARMELMKQKMSEVKENNDLGDEKNNTSKNKQIYSKEEGPGSFLDIQI